jgi:Endomembrane protein 70
MLSSIFASRAYYAFGFMALTAGVVMLTTATVTILFTYFILCAEEYRLRRFYRLFAVYCGADQLLSTDGIGEHSSQEEAVPSGSSPMGYFTGHPDFPSIHYQV